MIPNSHCRQSIFEEKFKFQYASEDIRIDIAPKTSFSNFCQGGILFEKVNMEDTPNI